MSAAPSRSGWAVSATEEDARLAIHRAALAGARDGESLALRAQATALRHGPAPESADAPRRRGRPPRRGAAPTDRRFERAVENPGHASPEQIGSARSSPAKGLLSVRSRAEPVHADRLEGAASKDGEDGPRGVGGGVEPPEAARGFLDLALLASSPRSLIPFITMARTSCSCAARMNPFPSISPSPALGSMSARESRRAPRGAPRSGAGTGPPSALGDDHLRCRERAQGS